METASILVVGGCGMTGSHIVGKLLAAYPRARVAVMSRNPTKNTFAGVSYHAGDMNRPGDVDAVLAAVQPTVVFHVAGLVLMNPGKPLTDAAVRASNYDGAVTVLTACGRASRRPQVRAFVFTSSASVVMRADGGFRDLAGADESYPVAGWDDDTLMYARAKAQAERVVLAADDARPGGMRTVALRPALVHGERDSDLLPSYLAMMRAGRTRMQLGDNQNRIAVTYVGNCADAQLLAAEKLLSPDPAVVARVAGEAFFISNDDNPRFWDFGRAIWALAGAPVDAADVRVINATAALWFAWAAEWVAWVRGVPPGLTQRLVRFSQMNRWYDISKARERLGYVPRVSLDEGLRRAVEWALENEAKTKASQQEAALAE